MFVLAFFVILKLFTDIFAQTSCTTPNGEEAQCIPFKQCDLFKNTVRQNPSEEVKRFLRESHCGNTNKHPLVCCGSIANFKTADTKDIIFPPLNFTPIDETHKNLNLLPPRTVCGEFILHDYLPRASSGTPNIEEYTWVALLEYKINETSTGYHCGGILFSSRYVLTAAHCVTGRFIKHAGNVFRVRLGEQNLKTNPDCDPDNYCEFYKDFDVEEVIPHPSYNLTGEELNDIALLRLAKPADFNDVVNPICLPINGETGHPEESGNVIVGWKQDTNASILGNINNLKYYTGVSFISLDECKQKYAPKNYKLTEQHFCHRDLQEGARCVADSGGPILNGIDHSDRRWNLKGILSVKICDTNEKNPAVYISTKVEYYINWILDNLKLNLLN